jgi:hypothetical protein
MVSVIGVTIAVVTGASLLAVAGLAAAVVAVAWWIERDAG